VAATITGLVKSILAGPLPAVPVFRDEETAGGLPSAGAWVVVHETLSRLPSAAEGRNVRLRRELVQVDVWQHRTPGVPDDPTVAATVERALDAALPAALTGGDTVSRLRPENSHRAYDPTTQLVVESLTVAVARHTT